MKRRSILIYLFILFLASISPACVNHNIESLGLNVVCDGFKTVSFVSDVKPIINSNCALSGCHNGDNGADLNWQVLANFQSRAQQVKRRVTLPSSDGQKMPLGRTITDDQIKLIVCWVDQGAMDN